jgi:hypothetical protein
MKIITPLNPDPDDHEKHNVVKSDLPPELDHALKQLTLNQPERKKLLERQNFDRYRCALTRFMLDFGINSHMEEKFRRIIMGKLDRMGREKIFSLGFSSQK